MNRMTNVVQTLCKKLATMPLLKFFGVVTMAVVPSMPIDVRAQAVQVEIAVENLQKGQVVRIVRDVKVVPEEHPADEDQKKRQKVEAKADRNADAEGKEDEKQADEKGKDDKKSKPVKPPKFLRDLVNGEMSFIKRVAKPTDEQMDEIVDRARTMLQEVADDIVHPANKPVRWQQGDLLIYGPRGERLTENPFDRIPVEFTKMLERILEKDQFQQYQREAKQREKVERELSVKAALRALDHRVVLTQSQYDELYELLLEKWKEVDLGAVTIYSRRNQMVPSIPKDLTDQVLNQRQKGVWKEARTGTMYLRLSDSLLSQLDEEWIQ